MTNIFEWLEGANQPPMAPPVPLFQPMDEVLAEDDPMDQITLLDIDQDGNMYFDVPHAWNPPMEQGQIYDGYIPIDPALHTITDSTAPSAPGQAFVTVPEQFAEVSRQILIYFAQTLEIPRASDETAFTTEELAILEPIVEEAEPPVPNILGGVCVNMTPKSTDIKEITDLRRISPSRQTFYLAKTHDDSYYWFHVPYADRDHHLRKLIGDYRRKSRADVMGRRTRKRRKVRCGENVGI